jgi:uncharacterized protein with GYD domain
MPNPLKYKSVSLTLGAYDKLVHVADVEDRSIGRQLSRLVDQAYAEVKPMPYKELATNSSTSRYGISSAHDSVIEND